tara:strand:+ start:219 stop:914 length:696 start_codon:yes stop_codon:yes gene_type:complete
MKKVFYGITLARSQSKGLYNKNLRKIGKKNLIEICLSNAIKSKFLKKIFLCSDSKKILNYSKKYQCIGIQRPKKLSMDKTHVFEVLNFLLKNKKIFYSEKNTKNYIVLLSPTSPLRRTSHIDTAIKKIIKENCSSLISITKNDKCIFKSVLINKKKIKPVFKINFINRNRQDFQNTYMPNGLIFIFDINLFLKKNKIISSNCAYLLNNEYEAIDIDTKEDLKNVKKLMKSK